MPARHVSQATIDRMIAESEQLRRERALNRPAAKVVNLDNALALFEPTVFQWEGAEYRVGPVGFLDGLRLQKASLRFKEWGKAPPQTEGEIDAQARYVADLLDFMHGLLRPMPAVNPFAGATAWEAGDLAGFFYWCQTKQTGQSRLRTGLHQTAT